MMQMSVSMNDGHSRSWRCQTSLVELVCTDAVVQQRLRKCFDFEGSNVKIQILDLKKIYTWFDYQNMDFPGFHRKNVKIRILCQKEKKMGPIISENPTWIFHLSPFIKINFFDVDSIYFWY